MSNAAMTWAAGLHPGRGVKSVLMCLADRASDHSGEDWTCFPSIESIMAWTDESRATVERHLKRLEGEGYISRKRRRRADGKLGIYDYTLHREAGLRAELKAARGGEATPPNGGSPDVNLTCGPCVNPEPAIRQTGASPHVNLTHQEPSGEPSDNPHGGRVREPGDQGFEEVAASWPETGLKRTNWGQARAAFARCCGLETAERLAAAAKACAVDPDIARGDFGWPGLHTWLAEERWRFWLPKPAAAEPAAARTAFAGPAEVFDQLVAVAADAGICLLGAGWREADRTILAPSGWAQTELERRVGPHRLRGLNIRIERAPAE